jgi:hypothetical protein
MIANKLKSTTRLYLFNLRLKDFSSCFGQLTHHPRLRLHLRPRLGESSRTGV